jgi:acetyl-CoA synthetase
MVPEAAYAMLACARIGAVHSVVFGGFSPDALGGRIVDCESTFVITCDEGLRGGKPIPLKANVDKAVDIAARGHVMVKNVLVVRRTGGKTGWAPGRDLWFHEEAATVAADCPPEPMNAEDPLFILYTSGSTGKPKGVLHTTGGYLVYASMTHQYVFDYHDGDIYWCTADVGWVTGHSYIVYGPLSNRATTLMFEGVPNYPDQGRFWDVIDKHNVNIFYTAPTAIRALMGAGDGFVKRSSRSSLRLLGSVGEPINPEAWEWYYNVVGDARCPIVDTWWQTETGGIMITPLPGATDLKAGSATRPFFGIRPELVDGEGKVLDGATDGNLCITDSWPGQMRTVYGDHERFIQTYFATYKGKYFTGDGCRRDSDGDYWITGRVDDVLNVSGHRLGTAEVESALVSHPDVSEAAVVGYPHDIKGQGIYCYVTLMAGVQGSDELRKALVGHVRTEIGPIASPDKIQFSPGLPKTRSGKIMRRILRKIAEDDFGALGDTSTLADPAVVDDLIANRQNKKG